MSIDALATGHRHDGVDRNDGDHGDGSRQRAWRAPAALAQRPDSSSSCIAHPRRVAVVCITMAFTINFFLSFAWDWPGVPALFSHAGWLGFAPLRNPLDDAPGVQGLDSGGDLRRPDPVRVVWIASTKHRPLQAGADAYSELAAFIIRASFWSVFLVGFVDAVISFVRVEDFLPPLVGDDMTIKLGLSKFRGQYVHLPLMALSCIIALFTRSLSVVWLALLIVLAEIQIVFTRFIFSYEQAFMGDLVRFWYASLFLLASAYSLVDEGHVRVDVFYARFSEKAQGVDQRRRLHGAGGAAVLGHPHHGMWTKGSSLASPLLNFEISQSGFGMYVKYLMAGLLVIFASLDGGAVHRILPRKRRRAETEGHRRRRGARERRPVAPVGRTPWNSSSSPSSSCSWCSRSCPAFPSDSRCPAPPSCPSPPPRCSDGSSRTTRAPTSPTAVPSSG